MFNNLLPSDNTSHSANKTINLKIPTSDNESLGAWFIMSDKYYHSLSSVPLEPQNHIGAALQNNPTILFFHGNGATRAYGVRVRFYKAFTARLGVNVLAVDYRGFADSTGTPSEAGLIQDGRAAFDWLLSNGAKVEDILIVGHSLGTGVSSQLVAKLDAEGLAPRGVVLLAVGCSTLRTALTDAIQAIFKHSRYVGHIPFCWSTPAH